MAPSFDGLVLEGSVVAVASDAKHEFSKPVRDTIKLIEGLGVEGDSHAGRLMQHRYLARKTPALPNSRQVHLMASELFAELACDGFEVAPGELGENVTTVGLSLIDFPLGTRLEIGSSAVVELTGLRTPCALIDRFQKGLKRAMIMKHRRPRFRCGVLAVVRASGQISPGDAAIARLPKCERRSLPEI